MKQEATKTKRDMPSSINFACVPYYVKGNHFLQIFICLARKPGKKENPPEGLSLFHQSFLKNQEKWLPRDKYVALAIQAIISGCEISVGPLEILQYPSRTPFGKHFGFTIKVSMLKGGDADKSN
ncbi:MAG: hypothetical protein WC682_02505 [Parcubacteria group bacterium]|jgi:hypothetical protein